MRKRSRISVAAVRTAENTLACGCGDNGYEWQAAAPGAKTIALKRASVLQAGFVSVSHSAPTYSRSASLASGHREMIKLVFGDAPSTKEASRATAMAGTGDEHDVKITYSPPECFQAYSRSWRDVIAEESGDNANFRRIHAPIRSSGRRSSCGVTTVPETINQAERLLP